MWEIYLELTRQMGPADKLAKVVQLSVDLRSIVLAGVRADHPGASEREILLRAGARYIDRETFLRAFKWHPDSNDPFPSRT